MKLIFKKLLCTVFFLVSMQIFAVQYWGEGAFVDFGYSSGTIQKVPIEGVLGIRKSFEKSEFDFLTGFHSFGTNLSASVLVEPFTAGIFSLGFKYEIDLAFAFPDEWGLNYTEIDNSFYVSAIFRGWDKVNTTKTIVSIGIDSKTAIQKLTNYTLILRDNSPTLEVQVIKRFLQKNQFMFRFATFDPLFHKIILNGWWQLGYSYDITSHITVGGLFELSYADQFTISGTIGGIQGKAFVVYRF